MADYIDRDEAIAELQREREHIIDTSPDRVFDRTSKIMIDFLKSIPTADAAPVRNGHWIPIADGEMAECSECGECFDSYDGEFQRPAFENFCGEYLYCPHCGARMDLEGK